MAKIKRKSIFHRDISSNVDIYWAGLLLYKKDAIKQVFKL